MSRRAKGVRLYFRAGRERDGKRIPGVWVIVDGRREHSTGFGAGDRGSAETALSDYIARKHTPERRERRLSEIRIADVIAIYLTDVVPGQARPEKAAERAGRLLKWWGEKTLADVNGANCRAYAAAREGQGPAVKGGRKGSGGGARRDLQDLSAAIGHHHAEGFHREDVKVILPPKGDARQRWLTRDEAAKLLRVCWRTREMQEGKPTAKRPLRHLCRFLLLGIYTGSRPGAILDASWFAGPKRALVDVENGVFHRRPDKEAETTKRKPTVKLAAGILGHVRRWCAIDEKAGRAHVVMFDGAPVASVKVALARAVDLAGISAGVTAYTLRHTCASWLVRQGLPTRLIADFIGTSEAMIQQHYGHLAPDYQDAAALAIGRK